MLMTVKQPNYETCYFEMDRRVVNVADHLGILLLISSENNDAEKRH